jgi:hypothetical protein
MCGIVTKRIALAIKMLLTDRKTSSKSDYSSNGMLDSLGYGTVTKKWSPLFGERADDLAEALYSFCVRSVIPARTAV